MKHDLQELAELKKNKVVYENYTIDFQIDNEAKEFIVNKLNESAESTPISIMPRIAAIHAGMTENHNFYSSAELMGENDPETERYTGIHSWTRPYEKPILKNHDTDSEPLGRVKGACFVTHGATPSSQDHEVIVAEIVDQDAIVKFLDGRYQTVSIGSRVEKMICSICGTDIVSEEFCGHWKGKTYDGALCYYIPKGITHIECSVVNVPADRKARVISINAESYAKVGESMVNLSKSPTSKEFVLQESEARTIGLITENLQGGKQPMDNQDLKDSLEESEAIVKGQQQATPPEENVDVAVLQAQNEGLKGQVAALTTEKATLEADKAALTEQVAALTAQVNTLTSEKNVLVQEKASLEQEKIRLLETNTKLASQAHVALAGQVADLKIAMGLIQPSEREAALAVLLNRSDESLNDTLCDLKAMPKVATIPEKVLNPGSDVKTTATPKRTKEEIIKQGQQILMNQFKRMGH